MKTATETDRLARSESSRWCQRFISGGGIGVGIRAQAELTRALQRPRINCIVRQVIDERPANFDTVHALQRLQAVVPWRFLMAPLPFKVTAAPDAFLPLKDEDVLNSQRLS